MNKIISIATDFSRYPAGRTRADGPYSGELFRTKMLEPALAAGDHLVVNFDGARGYGSSFLEEAFGGLVRAGFSVETINTLTSVRLNYRTNSTG